MPAVESPECFFDEMIVGDEELGGVSVDDVFVGSVFLHFDGISPDSTPTRTLITTGGLSVPFCVPRVRREVRRGTWADERGIWEKSPEKRIRRLEMGVLSRRTGRVVKKNAPGKKKEGQEEKGEKVKEVEKKWNLTFYGWN